MFTQFKSLPALFDHFSNDEICVQYLEQHRWNGKVTCPHCGSEKFYRTVKVKKDGSKVNQYKCGTNTCYKKFSVTVGTMFEASKIPLRLWFGAIYLTTAHRKGISSLQLARDLAITQKSAWFLMHRIRAMLTDKAPKMLAGTVEVDESYFGGREANKKKHKRTKGTTGRSTKTKTAVLGMIERGGRVVVQVVPDAKSKTITPIVKANVKHSSMVVTDEWGSYNGLHTDYFHETIQHKTDEYVRDGYWHTNTIEGFWSQLKRQIYGIHHFVSAKHLQRYCDDQHSDTILEA